MLKYVLLTLLDDRDCHGYEIYERFDRTLAGIWPLNTGQLYATLSRMERDGLVTSTRVAQERLPDRRVYTATDDGRSALRDWLDDPSERGVVLKEGLYLKMVLELSLHDRISFEVIARERQTRLELLRELEAVEAPTGTSADLVREAARGRLASELEFIAYCERFAT